MNTPPEAVAAIASFAGKLTPTQQTLLQNFPDFRSADEVRDYVAGMRAEIPQREVTAYSRLLRKRLESNIARLRKCAIINFKKIG